MQSDEYSRMYYSEEHLWWYVGLRGFLWDQLSKCTTSPDTRILDVGCGTGINLQLFEVFGQAAGVDFAPEAVSFCRERGLKRIARASIFHLPFPDRYFDIVSCMDVLGHSWVVDDVAALAEMKRVLKPGGMLFVHVAALEALRGQHDEVIMFSRRYSRTQLKNAVTNAGFRIRRLTFRNTVFMPLLLVHRTLSRVRRSHLDEAASDVKLPNPAVNRAMSFVMKLENHVASRLTLPIGSSLFCVAQRP